MELNPEVQTSANQPRESRRIRGMSLAVAGAALVILSLTSCADASPASSQQTASAAVANLPVIEGKLLNKVDIAKKDGFQVVIKSGSKSPLKDAKARLEKSGYTIYSESADSFGAKSKKYYVSVSVSSGQVTYVFVTR